MTDKLINFILEVILKNTVGSTSKLREVAKEVHYVCDILYIRKLANNRLKCIPTGISSSVC